MEHRVGTPPRILVADDDSALGALIGERLVNAGYDVSVVTTGYGAIEEAQRQRPDLMVMDINLVGSDGLTVVQRIRDQYPALVIPVILISGQSREWYREFGPRLAVSAYLQKPLDAREFLHQVDRAISREFVGE